MKKLLSGLFIGLLLQTAAHAAPAAYRFTGYPVIVAILTNGGGAVLLNPDEYSLPASSQLVIDFTYDDNASYSPDVPVSVTPGTLWTSESDNAIANLYGTVGDYRFAAATLHSTLWVDRRDTTDPITDNSNALESRVSVIAGAPFGTGFVPFTLEGSPLVNVSISLAHNVSPAGGAFDISLVNYPFGAQVTLAFDMGDGKFLSMLYDGQLQAVPVPPAFWLFGSGLAGMLVSGRCKKASKK